MCFRLSSVAAAGADVESEAEVELEACVGLESLGASYTVGVGRLARLPKLEWQSEKIKMKAYEFQVKN